MSAPIRIEQGRAMLLGGCAVTTPSSRGLRRPVARPQRPASPAGAAREHAYGAICAATDTHREYLCGVEVAALEVLPPGLGRMRIAPRPTPSSCIRGMSRPCRTPGARPWHGSRNRTINLPSSRISSATAPALTPPPAAAKWKSGSPWYQTGPGLTLAARATSAPSPRHRARSAPPQPGEGLARARPLVQSQLHRAHRRPMGQHHPIRLQQARRQQADPDPRAHRPLQAGETAAHVGDAPGIPSASRASVIWRR